MFQYREHVLAGGLISYGPDLGCIYHRAASYLDRILKGAKPGELPIEQPTKIHLAIDRETARALGITVSKELEFRADELIEWRSRIAKFAATPRMTGHCRYRTVNSLAFPDLLHLFPS